MQLKNQRSYSKSVRGFFIILILKGIMTFYTQRVHVFCWTKIQILIKTKLHRKWKIPHTVLERRTFCFSSFKNCKLKVKLWWVRTRERKKRAFFVPFILSTWTFFEICVLSQCIVYWTHFQNINNFTYQKTLLHTLFCLLFKSKVFSVFLTKAKFTECSIHYPNDA